MSLLLPISRDFAVPKTPCSSVCGDGQKVFFLVLPGLFGDDLPCKYHGQIPFWEKKRMRFGIRLDDEMADLPLDMLFGYYLMAKELSLLPASNIEPSDFWTYWM